MSQSRDQLPITDSRLELAGACQLKVVITLRLSTQTHDKIHEKQQTVPLGRRLHGRRPLSIDLRRAQCTHEHSAREHSGARGLG